MAASSIAITSYHLGSFKAAMVLYGTIGMLGQEVLGNVRELVDAVKTLGLKPFLERVVIG